MSVATAIQGRNLLSFMYDGFRRVVEPHAFGVDTKGHMALRAYQVSGGSKSGDNVGWKLFHIDEMLGVSVLPQTFVVPRPGYKRGDKAFSRITTQL